MKEMYREGGFVLAILDTTNYVVFDERKNQVDKNGKINRNYSYHTRMDQAEGCLASDWADEVTTNSSDWNKCRDGLLRVLRSYDDEAVEAKLALNNIKKALGV